MRLPIRNDPFKVAVVQHPPVFLNLEESIKHALRFIEEAAGKNANVIVFPETWLPGYPVWLDFSPNAALWDHPPAKSLFQILQENSLSIPGKHLDQLLEAAKKAEAYVVIGCHEKLGGTLYNTMLYLHKNGRDFKIHRKLMPTYSERMIWGQGDGSTLSLLNTEYGHIGGLICWEHWMPLPRAAMHAKQETLHIAQWPMVKEMNLIASRHYAFEGQCFVVAAGCVLRKGEIIEGFHSLGKKNSPALELLREIPGDKPDLILQGGSAVIAPNGDVIAGPVYDKETTLYADIQPELISQGKLLLDTDGHYSRPDIFRLEVNEAPQLNVKFKSGRTT